jgi:hypothetical protein
MQPEAEAVVAEAVVAEVVAAAEAAAVAHLLRPCRRRRPAAASR